MPTVKYLLAMVCCISFLSACQKNQDDVNLPIYDAIGGEFTLPSSLGKSVSLSDYKGQVVLLNFGFTSCPEICPMVLTRLAKLTSTLKQDHQKGADKVQVLFITIDAERDTAQHLEKFLKNFSPEFIGLTGTVEQTEAVSKQYASVVQKQMGETEGSYEMIHNDKIFLIDKRGRLRGLYGESEPDEKFINDIISLVEAEI